MADDDPIEITLPKNFTKEDVHKAITEEVVKKLKQKLSGDAKTTTFTANKRWP